jgi:two-component system chemotaxis sensor kinase CheA
MELERDPGDSEALNAVFRGFHSFKGLAGFLELWDVQRMAHEVETVLSGAREGSWAIDASAADVILECSDWLRHWLEHLEAELRGVPTEAPALDERLIARVHGLAAGEAAAGGLDCLATAVAGRIPADSGPPQEPGRPQAGPDDRPPSVPGPAAPASETRAGRRNEASAVRVETAKLDFLADMAGEMVIAESLVRHDPDLAAARSPQLQRKLAQLERITAELQRTAMALRLVPIGPLFRRMARLVRDLARQVGKNVEFSSQGDEIELDRSIVEELADPLMHMVRNALDHGIETPAERSRAGKPPAARLELRAHHHAGQVLIEIADDGRGLDREKIGAKALEKGLISGGEELSDAQIYNLIFEPGFSTAAQVTSVSGRGVGMDVVRKHIEKLRGRIEIRSAVGRGATFLLKLPLTLAIIDGLVVTVGSERYIVPLFAVREMFRPGPETVWTVRQRAEMALVRGTLLPVLRLHRYFGIRPRSEDPLQSVVVVAEVEGRRLCVLVDELIGKQEVVIKGLGRTFQAVKGVAGGAILGDGRVGLILDVDALYRDGVREPGC